MDKAKIAKLCNEIEDIVCDISRQTMNDIVSAESRMIFDKAKEIASEITEPPKSNGDRIRRMTDEELAEWLNGICNRCISENGCTGCPIYDGCAADVDWQERWLKQEVKTDDER